MYTSQSDKEKAAIWPPILNAVKVGKVLLGDRMNMCIIK